MTPFIVEDEASGFWTGKPWLVILEDGEPALGSFKTEGEAFEFVEEYEEERKELEHGTR